MDHTHNVLIVGGPDAGKTNFIIRFWLALLDKKGCLLANGLPDDAEYLDTGANEMLGGAFCVHTPRAEGHHNSYIPVSVATDSGFRGKVLTPDCSGEEWLEIYRKREWSSEWEDLITSSCSCLVFVRVDSEENVVSLDWITAERLFGSPPVESIGMTETPTQVVLVEWLQFLRRSFTAQVSGSIRPRVGIVISAWDFVPAEQQGLSPDSYLAANFPMLKDYIDSNAEQFEFSIFGVSIVEGDLKDTAFRDEYLKGKPRSKGYVIHTIDGTTERADDLTIPSAWAMGVKLS